MIRRYYADMISDNNRPTSTTTGSAYVVCLHTDVKKLEDKIISQERLIEHLRKKEKQCV